MHKAKGEGVEWTADTSNIIHEKYIQSTSKGIKFTRA